MILRMALLALFQFAMACTPDEGSGAGGGTTSPSKSSQPPIISSDEAKVQNCIPSAANNNCAPAGTGIEKCWNKLLDIEAAQACASSGKLFNRIKKVCVEAGIKLKTGCSIPDQDLNAAKDTLAKAFGVDSSPQLDQCGSYTVAGKEYLVAYVLAKKYTGAPDGFGTYAIRSELLCYKPVTGADQTCDTPNLRLSGTTNNPPASMTCD